MNILKNKTCYFFSHSTHLFSIKIFQAYTMSLEIWKNILPKTLFHIQIYKFTSNTILPIKYLYRYPLAKSFSTKPNVIPTWNPYHFLLPGKSKHELKAILYSIFYRINRVVSLILCGQGHLHNKPANNSGRRHGKYQLILI